MVKLKQHSPSSKQPILKNQSKNKKEKKVKEINRKTKDKDEAFLEQFRKLITTEPVRTGKPKNLSPEEMKRIWEPKV
jgi:hypothetical protein